MREIKFRAWHKAAKEMLVEDRIGACLKWLEEGQPIEVMQYTGLKDSKGKEIYEGDIVKYIPYAFSPDWTPQIAEIECDAPNGGYNLRLAYFEGEREYIDIDSNTAFEIIGNIYENPELLKGV